MIELKSMINKYDIHKNGTIELDLMINKYKLNLTLSNDKCCAECDKELNIYIKSIFNKIFINQEIKIKKIDLFSNNANISILNFKIKDKEFNIDLDWLDIKELNRIKLPFLNNVYTTNCIDNGIIKNLIYLDKNNKPEEKFLIFTGIVLYLDALMLSRILHIFFTINQFIFLSNYYDTINKSIFSKFKKEEQLNINKKLVEIKIEGNLIKTGKFLLNINIIIDGLINHLSIDSSDISFFKKSNFIKILNELHSDKFNIKTLTHSNTLKENLSNLVIMNNNDNLVISNSNYRDFFINGNDYIFNDINFSIEEILNINEFLDETMKNIKNILIFK